MKLSLQIPIALGLITATFSPLSAASNSMTPSLRSIQSARSQEFIRNGAFSDWADDKPAGWSLGGGSYEQDATMAGTSPHALRLTPLAPEEGKKARPLSISQLVHLEPDTDYVFSACSAQEGTGTTLVRIRAMENGKPVSDAVLDWNNGWSSGYPWHPLALKFRTGSHREYEVLLVHHAQPGNFLWLEQLSVQPDKATTVSPAAITLFTQSVMLPPGADPKKEIAPREIFLRGCPGEFEPAFLGLKAGEKLDQVELKLENSLTGPNETTIPAEAVTLRMTAQEGLLPLSRSQNVKAGDTLGWWITVRLPEASTPGTYRGILQISAGGQTISRLPLIAEVEPFTLPAPDIAMFVYHNERYFPKGGFLTAEQRAAYYRDMKEHGMNTVTVYNNPDIDGTQVDFEQDRSWMFPKKRIDELNENGYLLDEQEIRERTRFGLKPVMDLISRSELVAPGQSVLFLAHKTGQYGWGGIPSPALKAMMDEWTNHPEWPKPLYYVNDEIEGHPDRIAAARKIFDRLKELQLPLTTVSANIAVKETGNDYNVWIQLEKRITPEMAQQARDHNAQLWVYNCNMDTRNTQLTRALFGLWAYRSGIKGVGLWGYYDAKDWYADADGTIHGRNGRFGLSRICPSPTGPIPTVSWETTREGVKDYRYAMLFDQLLARVKEKAAAATNDEELQRLVDSAVRARKSLLESIPVDAMAPLGSNPYGAAVDQFIPVLGMSGDPRLTSEQKRTGLAAYVRRMDAVLKE